MFAYGYGATLDNGYKLLLLINDISLIRLFKHSGHVYLKKLLYTNDMLYIHVGGHYYLPEAYEYKKM